MTPYLVLSSVEKLLQKIGWNHRCFRVNDDEGEKSKLLCVGSRGAVVIDEQTGSADQVPLSDVKKLTSRAQVDGEMVVLMKG